MPKVSQAHLDARRQQILEAAIECFSRQGFHRTSIQDIVQQSELSPGAIYSYFSSKDEIVEAIANERHSREGALFAAVEDAQDAEVRFYRLLEKFFGLLDDPEERQRRRVGIQMWAEALRNPQILTIIRQGVDEPQARLARMIAEAQASGDLPAELNAPALARVMVALFQGFILQQAWDEQVDVKAYVETIKLVFRDILQTKNRPGAGN